MEREIKSLKSMLVILENMQVPEEHEADFSSFIEAFNSGLFTRLEIIKAEKNEPAQELWKAFKNPEGVA